MYSWSWFIFKLLIKSINCLTDVMLGTYTSKPLSNAERLETGLPHTLSREMSSINPRLRKIG